MVEYNYLKWQDFYKNVYIDKYKNFKTLVEANNISSEELINDFIDIFYSSCGLLRVYLGNNGWFYDTSKRVIKYAFRAGILDNAETFIIIDNMLDLYKKQRLKTDEVINYGIKEHSYIFDSLNNKFMDILEQNG